jgi:hypothetical protein
MRQQLCSVTAEGRSAGPSGGYVESLTNDDIRRSFDDATRGINPMMRG